MKAKEYFERYKSKIESGMRPDNAAISIARDMVLEAQTLLNQRHCQTNAACLAVFYELEDKYAAYARLVNAEGKMQLYENGYRKFVQHQLPELWQLFVAAGIKGDKREAQHG